MADLRALQLLARAVEPRAVECSVGGGLDARRVIRVNAIGMAARTGPGWSVTRENGSFFHADAGAPSCRSGAPAPSAGAYCSSMIREKQARVRLGELTHRCARADACAHERGDRHGSPRGSQSANAVVRLRSPCGRGWMKRMRAGLYTLCCLGLLSACAQHHEGGARARAVAVRRPASAGEAPAQRDARRAARAAARAPFAQRRRAPLRAARRAGRAARPEGTRAARRDGAASAATDRCTSRASTRMAGAERALSDEADAP